MTTKITCSTGQHFSRTHLMVCGSFDGSTLEREKYYWDGRELHLRAPCQRPNWGDGELFTIPGIKVSDRAKCLEKLLQALSISPAKEAEFQSIVIEEIPDKGWGASFVVRVQYSVPLSLAAVAA